MAIKHTATTTCRSVDGDMTVEEFQGVAEEVRRRQGRAHKPGRASTSHPLLPHGRFSGWKSARGIRYAEADGDGFIDDLEEFAHKCLGNKIVVPYQMCQTTSRRSEREASGATYEEICFLCVLQALHVCLLLGIDKHERHFDEVLILCFAATCPSSIRPNSRGIHMEH